MTISIPAPEDLDDAISRGYVRERIAAAGNILRMLAEIRKQMALNYLGDHFNDGAIDDLISDITGNRDRLQESVDLATRDSDRRAPRRADPEMIERVRVA